MRFLLYQKAAENKIDKFSLVVESKNEFNIYSDVSEIWNDITRTYMVNVRRLCFIIGASASAYYKENKSKFGFFNFTITDWN